MSWFLTELHSASPDPTWDQPPCGKSHPSQPSSLSSPSVQSVPTEILTAAIQTAAIPEPVQSDRFSRGQTGKNGDEIDSGLSDPVLADPVLADPVLADPVLADPVLTDPGLTDPGLEPAETGFASVFRNLNFMRLWSGQVFSQVADKVYLVLMIMMISHRFEAPDQSISGWVSAIMVAFTIPAILLGSIAGVYADRHPKKTILVFSNFLRSAFVLSLPVLLPLCQGLRLQHIPLGFYVLLLITFLVSTLTQFFAPAEQAIIPLIVEKSALLSANSLYTTTMMGAMIIGFAVGEPLLDWAKVWVENIAGWHSGEVLFVGSCYALAGITLMGVLTTEKSFASEDDRSHPPLWQEVREGWLYLSQNPIVRSALLQLVVLFSVFAALAVLAVRLAEVIPQLESDQFGWLLAIGSLGMGLGAFTVGHSGDRFCRSTLVRTGHIGMALSLLGVAIVISQRLFNPLNGVLLCITSLGFFAALIGIPLQTTLQEETPAAMRGKVFGLQNNGVNIALSVPLVLASVAEQNLGLGWTFTALAIVVIINN